MNNKTKKAFERSPATNVGHVELRVYSIQRSLLFYKDLLGFKSVGKTSDENALLSTDGSGNGIAVFKGP